MRKPPAKPREKVGRAVTSLAGKLHTPTREKVLKRQTRHFAEQADSILKTLSGLDETMVHKVTMDELMDSVRQWG